MITYTDPITGNICQCSKASSVPEGVPYKEVPNYEGREFRNALVDYDIDGNPVFDLPTAQEIKAKQADLECEAALAVITDGYSEAEMKTWAIQETEARSVNEPTPMLDGIALATGKTVEEVKLAVIAKSDAFKAISGAAVGQRQAKQNAVLAATTIGELQGL